MIGHYQRCISSPQTTALSYTAIGSFTTATRLAGMTTNRLLWLFDKHTIKTKKVLPRAICIDEFKGDVGGERFHTVVVDVETKRFWIFLAR
ncbi:hypothetical protein [Virgibacillus sp. DJP39]|uniref:hypothetical protein n=1 Tax=Virgibacillus sp. DJP39 TaxID=3409790 RepID=UPI003BB77161